MFQANTFITSQQSHATVAGLSNGNFFIAWEGFKYSSELSVFGQFFHPNNSKIGEEFKINADSYSGHHPRVSYIDNDKFIVVWRAYGIFGQIFYNNGTRLGNEFSIDSNKPNNQANVVVASLCNGTLLLFGTLLKFMVGFFQISY